MQIGILLPNWIGDVVMATPALRALHRRFGSHATMIGVMRPYVSQALSGAAWLDETIHYDRKSPDRELRIPAVAAKLRKRKLDALVVLPNSISSAVLAFLGRARKRIGYARNSRSPLLTHTLKAPRSGGKWTPVSAVDYFLEIAYAMGCEKESRKLELNTLPEDEEETDRIWENLGLNDVKHVVIFNTGGAYGAAKHWPTEHYVELARRITDRDDAAVLVICGPAEAEAAAEIERRAGRRRVTSMAQQDKSLGVAMACIRRSQAMVTTDSGPRFFGVAFDVPMISMFGPIDPRWSTTYQPRELVLWHDTSCRPCGQRTCPEEHHRCMRELSVQRVHEAVLQQLAANDRAAA